MQKATFKIRKTKILSKNDPVFLSDKEMIRKSKTFTKSDMKQADDLFQIYFDEKINSIRKAQKRLKWALFVLQTFYFPDKKDTFQSPYEQYRSKNGMKFHIIDVITKKDKDHDEEVLPMYIIRLEDKTVIEAWPEEIFKTGTISK